MTSDERWSQISRLYHDAVSVAPADRAEFLRKACGPDDALRAEIESLLIDDSRADRLLEPHGHSTPKDLRRDLTGQRIGVYELRSLLGAGGMGEVYRAHDPKLGREVAIKVLPPIFTANPERLARFSREARLLAALNHPNIGAIYGVEESDGLHALVLELVDGPTLADRLEKRPIPIVEALGIARQIADGLDAAHEKGIVHRDLKPANITITSGGIVKILDFGLAKLDAHDAAADLGQSPTVTVGGTRAGTLLGTAAYMSPEQVRGFAVDKRADFWAFGCVLYEMLAGRIAFAGATVPDTLAAVLEHEPNWNALPSALPRTIRHLLQHCLEKDPNSRPRDMRGVRKGLEDATVARARRVRGWIAAALVVAAGVLPAWLLYRGTESRRAEEAIAEATRLADQDDYGASLARVADAARIIPDDARVGSLWKRVSVTRPIQTVPPGADVYIKRYDDAGDTWELVGRTPIAHARLPRGIFRWRVQRDGFQALEFIAENHRIPAQGETPGIVPRSAIDGPSIELRANDTSTPMVTVPTSSLSLRQQLPHYDSPSIPAGTFRIGKYEVTNAEFKRFVDAGGYERREFWTEEFVKDGRTISWEMAMAEFRDRTGRPGPSGWEVGTYPAGRDRYPVGGVSWYESAAYATFVGKSLPTVYHWVKAAGVRIAGYITPFSNISANGITAVGGRPGVSPFGAFDMAGNVREWVWNEMQTGSARYILGGAWTDPGYAFQHPESRSPFDRAGENGFRVAEYLDSQALPDALTGPIPRPARDYTKEQPVSDEVFRAYQNLFAIDPEPLDPKVESIDSSAEGWSKEKVSFTAAYDGERVPAYLFLPRNVRPPYQTVVYFPGGDAGNVRTSEALVSDMFDFLMLSGRAVLCPIYKGTYERQVDGVTRFPRAPGANPTRASANLVVQYNTDIRRGVDYLQTRPDIQMTALAYYGFSWGAANGSIALALEPRFKVGLLLNGGFHPFNYLPEVDPLHFAPRVRVPVLMLNGDNDSTFPVVVQKRLFTLLGTPSEDKRHVLYEGGHGAFGVKRSEMIREMLEWLDRYLGPVISAGSGARHDSR